MKIRKKSLVIVLSAALIFFIAVPANVNAGVAGDVNRDGKRGLEDAVIILQELSGKEHSIDYDEDGFDTSTDCDDDDPNTYPGAMEICDGVDNDCNDIADEGAQWANKDQQCLVGIGACEASGIYVCDAADPTGPTICSAAPGAGSTELCDGIDNNCDGTIDQGITAPMCPMQDEACAGSRQLCGGVQGWLPCDYTRGGIRTMNLRSRVVMVWITIVTGLLTRVWWLLCVRIRMVSARVPARCTEERWAGWLATASPTRQIIPTMNPRNGVVTGWITIVTGLLTRV